MAGLSNLKKGRAAVCWRSVEFNIDNGAGTTVDDAISFPFPVEVVAIRAVYTEATDSAGSASANFKVGSALAGAQHCAATALEVSKSVGTYTAATLVGAEVLKNGSVYVRHTGAAATDAGKYRVEVWYTVADKNE